MKPITLNPLDIVVLIKIAILKNFSWHQKPLADALHLSQSEISKSIARTKFAGFLDPSGKKIMRLALFEFLQYGIGYAFPERPGSIVRGIPTAHSAKPLNNLIASSEHYVWPSGKGKSKGQSITPLYPAVTEAVHDDEELHEMLALVDAIRVGRAREKELAVKILKKRILDGE